ncbi:hypothetical protein ACN26Y_08395 [Micromonospora sp. WMMD558]|uniref:hypothetical protein n=1 Tax=unclassified Micromonospora TaxID=2617518 RepID=UPI0018AFDD2D|nr:hypothetical protein [Micromonospora sp. WMMC415]
MTDDTGGSPSTPAPGKTRAPRAKRTAAKKAASGRTARTEVESPTGVDAPAADAPTAGRARTGTKRTGATKAAPKDGPARPRKTTRTVAKPATEQAGPTTAVPPAAAAASTAEDDSTATAPHGATPAPVPAATTAPRPAEPAEPPALTRTPEVVARRVLDHPGYAPELLALAAVQGVGPRARDWAERLRSAYPKATGDGLARLATRRYVRQAGVGGAAAALAGVFAPVAELGAVLWTQAGLVLHLAAAYDRDPTHPDRAVELLVLTQVHPDEDSARAALRAARAADGPGEAPWPRAVEAAWRLAAPLAAQAGGWLALRLASRLLPGAAALAAATGDAAATERLAARAVAAYRPARAARIG